MEVNFEKDTKTFQTGYFYNVYLEKLLDIIYHLIKNYHKFQHILC